MVSRNTGGPLLARGTGVALAALLPLLAKSTCSMMGRRTASGADSTAAKLILGSMAGRAPNEGWIDSGNGEMPKGRAQLRTLVRHRHWAGTDESGRLAAKIRESRL